MSKNGTLSARQRRAIQSLMTCPTIAEAAEQAGVGRTTLYRWLADDTFAAELSRAQAQALDGVLRELLAEATASIRVLAKVRDDPNESGAVRKDAAYKLLSLLPELRPPDVPTADPAQVARELVFSAQWVTLRTAILDALADFPEARLRVAQAIGGNGYGG